MKDIKIEIPFSKNGKKYSRIFTLTRKTLEGLYAQDVPTARTFLNEFVHFIKNAQIAESLV